MAGEVGPPPQPRTQTETTSAWLTRDAEQSTSGRNGWLTQWTGSHDGSELPDVDVGTNEGGEFAVTRKRPGTVVSVHIYSDGTVMVEHGRSMGTRRAIAKILPPDD